MFTIQEILTATGGRLHSGTPSDRVKGVSSDSRSIQSKEAFIAIRGDHFDGHQFVPQLIKQGVKTFIVSKPVKDKSVTVIVVKDTVKALGHLARFHRKRFDIPVIGITGSAGKTTTKEMVAAVLKTQFHVLSNVGTHNNHMGVPQTLLRLTSKHEVAVIEMGTNQPGDIPWLAEIAQPTIAVLTNIGESHLEKLKTLSGVFEEKSALAKAIGAGGHIIYNSDDPYLKKLANGSSKAERVAVSMNSAGRYRATGLALSKNGGLSFKALKKLFFLKTFSIDMAYNALAAIACGKILGVAEPKIQKALKSFVFDKGRLEILKVKGVDVINDSYNANPVSMRSAIKTLDAFPAAGRRILICADMLELGEETQRLHYEVGRAVAASRTEVLMTMGESSRWIVEAARRLKPGLVVFNFVDLDDLKHYLSVLCRRGDVVLIKGSRRMKMEQVVEFLMSELRT